MPAPFPDLSWFPWPLALTSPDGTVAASNSAAEKLLDLRPGVSLRDRLKELPPGTGDFLFSEGFRSIRATAAPAAEGRTFWLFEDVSASTKAAAEAAAEERRRTLGFLSGGMAHEIGNPLSSISAIVQLLQLKTAEPETRDRLALVEKNVDRITEIVQRILQFARPDPGSPALVPLRPAVEAVASLARTHGATQKLAVNVEGEASAWIAREPVQQAFLALVLHASEVMPSGGRLDVALSTDGGAAVARFRDHGPGVEPAKLPDLFLPFAAGGMGLAIARANIERQRGRLEARSEPGQGTTFTVMLPVGEQCTGSC